MEYLGYYFFIGLLCALIRLGLSFSQNGRLKLVEIYSYTPFIIIFWPLLLIILLGIALEKR